MPGRDGTGPLGLGAMRGSGLGVNIGARAQFGMGHGMGSVVEGVLGEDLGPIELMR